MTNPFLRQPPLQPEFGTFQAPESHYPEGMQESAFYLTMRDGIRIAVELYLPAAPQPGDRLPTLVVQTRYWREPQLRVPFRWWMKRTALTPREKNYKLFFTRHGFAIVHVDVRGTGASFGVYPHPWSQASFEDAREVVNWIVEQPWSNGRVGSFGVSYGGTSAEFLALLNHPAVKVVIPKFNHPDAFMDISHPGGAFNQRFIRFWGLLDAALDHNSVPPEFGRSRLFMQGVKPVDGADGGRLLKQAVKEHASNGKVFEMARRITCRDEHLPDTDGCMEDFSVHARKVLLESTSTRIVGWGSWMDAGTADAVLRRFLTFPNAGMGIIGAWDHGGNRHASPFLPPESEVSPAYPQQLAEMLRIFSGHLKDGQPEPALEKVLYYYTMGEEKWKSTAVWPPTGMQTERWVLDGGFSLRQGQVPQEVGADVYPVDFSATTGNYNVWWEMGIFEKKTVMYPDRSDQAGRVLAYTSAPLLADLEISGYPVVSLWVTSTEPDGNFFVYLEDVSPDGRVTYITEGHLRAVHRRVSAEKPPYQLQVPYHTYRQSDALPLVPGEKAELTFGLNPTSVLLRKGHCLRVSIAGHDEGTFARVPEEGTPVITVFHSPEHPSRVDLPCRRRSE